jgi:hypothetical protein
MWPKKKKINKKNGGLLCFSKKNVATQNIHFLVLFFFILEKIQTQKKKAC